MGRRPLLAIVLLGFALPCAGMIAVTLLAPWSDRSLFSIRGPVWCLFACAPLTALCLHLCNRLIARANRGGADQ